MQEWRNRSQLMPSLDDLKRTIAREFGTPALVIDLDKVEANIKRVQAICDKAGVANQDAQDPQARAGADRSGRQGHHLPEARRG
jgi:hypothetical protein